MKLGILAENFRVYHRLLSLLKEMDQPFESLLSAEDTADFDLVITDANIHGRNIYRTNGTDEFRLKQMIKARNSERIVVGIDPGPTPGIATVANDVVIDRRNIYNVAEVGDYVAQVGRECRYSKFVVKIGDGDRRYRNAIIKQLENYDLQVVNEKGSSRTIKRGDDSSSAVNIALSNNVL